MIDHAVATFDQISQFFHAVMQFVFQMKQDLVSLGFGQKPGTAFIVQSQPIGAIVFVNRFPFAHERVGHIEYIANVFGFETEHNHLDRYRSLDFAAFRRIDDRFEF